ncbi:hypothetical protein ACE1AT_04200 [Pelatocladus sp. BLCC-F211]|uniref:hypothetical protein n=1 Tax=Pelatocladus sp. BLCC-F211 TaxID=3342752 RepID=UPI0035B9BF61
MVPDSSGGARSIQLSYSPKIMDITLHDTTYNSYQLSVTSYQLSFFRLGGNSPA